MRQLNHIFEEFQQREAFLVIQEQQKRWSWKDFRDNFEVLWTDLNELIEQNAKIEWKSKAYKGDALKKLLNSWRYLEDQCRRSRIEDSATSREGWGYTDLRSVQRYLPKSYKASRSSVFWYDFGQIDEESDWLVDKEALLRALLEEAWDKDMWICPSFDAMRISRIVQRLPEKLRTGQHSNWRLKKADIIEGNKVVSKVVGVDHKRLEEESPSVITTSTNGNQTNEEQKQGEDRKRFIPNTTFNDIGGVDQLLSRIREVIELPLKRPDIFKHLNIKPHRGVLLYGPPGCGKTMIAKAIAHEIQAHFISVKGPEILNKYYGQSEENLRNLFEEARDMQPAIIFFDEIDAIAQNRSSSDNLRMDARLVNQLLSLMDGVEAYGHLCVIAATNRPELIDDALLRPGRFDYKMEIPMPDEEGCKRIFDIQTKDMPLDKSLHIEQITNKLLGLSGAEIAYTVREAAYNCLRRQVDFENGFEITKLDNLAFDKFLILQEDFENAFSLLKTENS